MIDLHSTNHSEDWNFSTKYNKYRIPQAVKPSRSMTKSTINTTTNPILIRSDNSY